MSRRFEDPIKTSVKIERELHQQAHDYRISLTDAMEYGLRQLILKEQVSHDRHRYR